MWVLGLLGRRGSGLLPSGRGGQCSEDPAAALLTRPGLCQLREDSSLCRSPYRHHGGCTDDQPVPSLSLHLSPSLTQSQHEVRLGLPAWSNPVCLPPTGLESLL